MAGTVTEVFNKSRTGSIDSSGRRSVSKKYNYQFDPAIASGLRSLQTALTEMADAIPIGTETDIGLDAEGEVVTGTFNGTMSWTFAGGTEAVIIFDLQFSNSPSAATPILDLITTQGTSRASVKNVWRTPCKSENDGGLPCSGGGYGSWDEPAGGWDDPIKGDIGGASVDVGGTPTSITTVDRRFETTVKVPFFPYLDNLSFLVGKRNDKPYEGGDRGTILYLGFSWNYDATNDLWVINHQFAVDKETRHCEQVAKCTPDGEVIPSKKELDSETIIFVADTVYWVQPFPVADFAWLPNF
jgi:hypothetical protein